MYFIGQTFKHNGHTYRCMDATGMKRGEACNNCSLKNLCTSEDFLSLDCTKSTRSDNKDVFYSIIKPIKRVETKKTPEDMFKKLNVFVSPSVSIRYEKSTDITTSYMILRGLTSNLLELYFEKGVLKEFKVYPSRKMYDANTYYIKCIGTSIYVYDSTGRVDMIEKD